MPPPVVKVEGHFGEWLQGRLGPDGPVVLVTVRCPPLSVEAPGEGTPPFTPAQLDRFAGHLGLGALPGARRNFPMGAGAGGSTATLVAMARAGGFGGPPDTLAAACLAIEGASDPLMFERPDRLLWASREGRILRDIAPPPRCEILGGFWGEPRRTDPTDMDFDDITDLTDDWAQATEAADLPRAAAIATESARRCTARRGPADPTADLAGALGALGWLRAHTGSARGLIFAPSALPATGADALSEAGLTQVLTFRTGSI
ncbi:propanediol utilization protein [Maritimibacter sp. 55A14]|uniref:propanediol utilization protein n=1 Tax=Maritimibacter sp. 55A14 TaxID=2174844 RepID=UPI000D60B842|nr:propanediol utilization protein [Maritimibacter sp. 55A14]PWE33009.1 propanediol utilization protein [Maritimibacter sp. 55A14]